ncbi:hypothetical protein [Serratia sp. DD3]|uniref:hypothetical protein n=1 Tax=Serratia sp. DD3 TaxID=1410619 RepID=UPI0003C515B0|nr:hypothetical protein [Serratia sp. DD3]KEY57380.1 hypothetical protein SRDD_37500 [Serratia sp. DD3]
MIPRFAPFSKKYLRVAIIPVVLTSSILTSSLIRNAIDITLLEIITGLSAICLSIVWTMMRDGRGYWAYSIFTARAFESPEVLAGYTQRNIEGMAKLLYRPFWASLVTLSLVVALSCLIWLGGADWRYTLIALLGVVILPTLMLIQLNKSIPFNIILALNSYNDINAYRPRQRSLPGYVAEDLLLSLLINFALVFPIARKPAFSLAAGYSDPAFVIAFMILMGIVILFMLAFASRSRRYVLFGEILNGTLDTDTAPFAPWSFTSKLTRFKRALIWLLATLLWSIVICLIFAAWHITPQFIPLYLCALLPLLAVYCVERYQTLYSNFNEALEMRKRHLAHANPKAIK